MSDNLTATLLTACKLLSWCAAAHAMHNPLWAVAALLLDYLGES